MLFDTSKLEKMVTSLIASIDKLTLSVDRLIDAKRNIPNPDRPSTVNTDSN